MIKKWGTIIFVVILLLSVALLGLANSFFVNNLVVNPAVEPRQVQSLNGFIELWNTRTTSFPIKVDNWELRQDKIFMRSFGNSIILPVVNQGNIFSSQLLLTSFDQDSGEILWQLPIRFKNDLALGSNSTNIILVTEDAHPSNEAKSTCSPSAPFCNVMKISAYDPFSGEEVWTISQGNIRLADRLYVDNDLINVTGFGNYGSSDAKYSFDPTNGQKFSEFQTGINIQADQTNHESIVSQIITKPHYVVSNFADNGEELFFLTDEGILWAVEKVTGNAVGQVQFSNAPLLLSFENYQRGFSVVVNDNNVTAYLGDSEQIFTFKFTPP